MEKQKYIKLNNGERCILICALHGDYAKKKEHGEIDHALGDFILRIDGAKDGRVAVTGEECHTAWHALNRLRDLRISCGEDTGIVDDAMLKLTRAAQPFSIRNLLARG